LKRRFISLLTLEEKKMLRRKMLAVAVATTLMAPAVFADSKNVDMYGVVAYGWMYDENSAGDKDWTVLNESRIGFKGSKELKNGPKFIWQIESGFLGPNGLTGAEYESGTLGTRDTFGGFTGSWGTVRFGRLLSPYGELLDWPYDNGGLFPIMEASQVHGEGTYVRHSNHIRFDSPASNVTYSLDFGRGDAAIHDSKYYSALVNFKVSTVQLHVGYESHDKDTAPTTAAPGAHVSDTASALIGYEVPIGSGFSSYGVFMHSSRDDETDGKYERDQWQAALVYASGDWIYKYTYAKNEGMTLDGNDFDDGGHMYAVQALYLVDPSAVWYARYVKSSDPTTTVAWWQKSRILLGMEYYF